MKKTMIATALVLALTAGGAALADADERQRGYLGVTLHSTELIHDHEGREGHEGHEGHDHGTRDLNMIKREGLFIGGVLPGGPAEAAGLAAHDKIVGVDGRDVNDLEGLRRALDGRVPGDRVTVIVERDGREQSIDVRLGERPVKERLHVERFGMAVDPGNRAFVGIESQGLHDQLASFFDVEGGVLVTRVIEGTPAASAGLEAGDVIVAWNDRPVRQSHDLHEAINAASPGERIDLTVSRRGAESIVGLTLVSAAEVKHEHMLRIHADDVHFAPKLKVKIKEKKGGGE